MSGNVFGKPRRTNFFGNTNNPNPINTNLFGNNQPSVPVDVSGDVFSNPANNNFFGSNDKNLNPIQDDVFGKRPPVITIESQAYIRFFLEEEWIENLPDHNYSLSIPESVHRNGIHPLIEVYEYDGALYYIVTIDQITVDSSGEIMIYCNQPFNGKLVVNR